MRDVGAAPLQRHPYPSPHGCSRTGRRKRASHGGSCCPNQGKTYLTTPHLHTQPSLKRARTTHFFNYTPSRTTNHPPSAAWPPASTSNTTAAHSSTHVAKNSYRNCGGTKRIVGSLGGQRQTKTRRRCLVAVLPSVQTHSRQTSGAAWQKIARFKMVESQKNAA